MKRPHSALETSALALLVASTAAITMTIPRSSWRTSFADPCHLGAVSGIAVAVALLVTRSLGDRGARPERRIVAFFLAGMPLVYVASWFLSPDADARWLGVELAAVPVYATLALVGLRRSPWILAGGIAAHGVFWDAWHYGRTPFMPDWYAMGCLVMDVTMALYVATRATKLSAHLVQPSASASDPASVAASVAASASAPAS